MEDKSRNCTTSTYFGSDIANKFSSPSHLSILRQVHKGVKAEGQLNIHRGNCKENSRSTFPYTRSHPHLHCLNPLSISAQQTADNTGKSNQTLIHKRKISKCSSGNKCIKSILCQLIFDSISFPIINQIPDSTTLILSSSPPPISQKRMIWRSWR